MEEKGGGGEGEVRWSRVKSAGLAGRVSAASFDQSSKRGARAQFAPPRTRRSEARGLAGWRDRGLTLRMVHKHALLTVVVWRRSPGRRWSGLECARCANTRPTLDRHSTVTRQTLDGSAEESQQQQIRRMQEPVFTSPGRGAACMKS